MTDKLLIPNKNLYKKCMLCKMYIDVNSVQNKYKISHQLIINEKM